MKAFLKVSLILLGVLMSHWVSAQYVPKEEREKEKRTDSTQVEATVDTPQKTKRSRPSELSDQSFFQRLTFGGNLGFGFGNPTFVDIAPTVGYRFTDKFTAGLGFNYLYYDFEQRFSNGTININSSYYGGRVYGQYFIIDEIFAWAEFEGLNVEFFNTDGQTEREWQYAPLIGGGAQVPIGNRGGIYFLGLYNLNHSDTSWRGTPWVTRVGFNF